MARMRALPGLRRVELSPLARDEALALAERLLAENPAAATASAALVADEAAGHPLFIDALVRELEEAAREHARAEDYVFVGPVTVTAIEDPGLRRGRFSILSEVREGPSGLSAASIVLADGERIVLGPEAITIGRLPESTVVVTDPNASRRHAEIRRVGNDVVVVDLNSTNGTRVNGAGIQERKLADGDEIVVGTTFLRFETS